MTGARQPRIVGIGGSTRAGSTTEAALAFALDSARERGAETSMFSGPALVLPPYQPGPRAGELPAHAMLEAIRAAAGVLIASPGYHGTISGLAKNALDYLEELRADDPPYLSGKPVGCIATAFGWQAAVNTLSTLRQIVHALRGWPSPLGAAVNMADHPFDADGALVDERVKWCLSTIAAEVLDFAAVRIAAASGRSS